MTTKGYARTYKYQRLLDLLDPANNLVVGVGNTSPWAIEAAPPIIDVLLEEQEELQLLLPVTKKVAVKEVLVTPATTHYVVANKIFKEVSSTFTAIRTEQATKLLVETKLDHSKLTVGSYRSIALYQRATIPTEQKLAYTPNEIISKSLLYIEQFQAVDVQPDVTETIRMVIDV